MKKRLRKKFRIGEFQEMGFQLDFHATSPSEEAVDKLLDELIGIVTLMGLCLCGGGNYEEKKFSFFVSCCGSGTVDSKERQVLADWLKGHPDVDYVQAGELKDAWYECAD